MTADVWVFGYGSLIWRPSFPFEERRRATIHGDLPVAVDGTTSRAILPAPAS